MTIKVGDVVTADRMAPSQGDVAGGEQRMTVDSVGEWCGRPACVCKWFTQGNEPHEAEFFLGDLRAATPDA